MVVFGATPAGLRYLVAICKDLGRPYDSYQQKLARLDRAAASTQSGGRGALTRVGDGEGGGGRISRPTGALGRVHEDEDPMSRTFSRAPPPSSSAVAARPEVNPTTTQMGEII